MLKKLFLAIMVALALVLAAAALLPLLVPPQVERHLRTFLEKRGFPADVQLDMGYRFGDGLRLCSRLNLAILGSPWHLRADADMSLTRADLRVRISETAFSHQEPVLRKLLQENPLPGVTNLTFSGTFALDAEATAGLFQSPTWSIRAPVKDLTVTLATKTFAGHVEQLTVIPRASGIGRHYDIPALRLKAKSLEANKLTFSDLRAQLVLDEKTLILTEATANFLNGTASIYALRLDTERLNAGFTLLADDIDAGETLKQLRGFKGSATGRLHGKIRLSARDGGREIRVREAFLYSIPGETGKIKLKDPKSFSDNLSLVGLDAPTRENVANALTDLNYSVLRLKMSRHADDATLSTHVVGTATRGKVSVPVDLTVNLHGELEQILNLGLYYSNQLKGKHP